MRRSLFILIVALAAPAVGSPPPPPPDYVSKAARILATNAGVAAQPGFSQLFADDMVAYLDGEKLAVGKAQWIALQREEIGKFRRRVDGFSVASLPSSSDSGGLLIIDEVDPLFPPGDPRWTTRATVFQFGPDQLIHWVRIIEARGFLQARSQPDLAM